MFKRNCITKVLQIKLDLLSFNLIEVKCDYLNPKACVLPKKLSQCSNTLEKIFEEPKSSSRQEMSLSLFITRYFLYMLILGEEHTVGRKFRDIY